MIAAACLATLIAASTADFTVQVTGRSVTPSKVPVNPATQKVGPLPLKNFQDVEYVATISLGSDSQLFTVVMDTGSANLWVSSTGCTDIGCSKMHKFNSSASSTFKNENMPFSLRYGTGSCSGEFVSDTLAVSGVRVPVEWGLATTVAAFFENTGIDGIFGLGMTGLASGGVTPPLYVMAEKGIISKKLMGISLSSVPGVKGGFIDFGYADFGKFNGPLVSTPLIKTLDFEYLYYMINFGTFKVGSKSFNGCAFDLLCEAVVDTGTSLLLGPNSIVEPMIAELNVATDCSNYNSLPDFTIQIAGQDFVIPPSVYVLKAQGQCQLLIGKLGPEYESPFWIFGDTFLRTVYTVIDIDTMTASFGRRAL